MNTADRNGDASIMDKSMRSVFIGNIPYEATEEKLKDIFSEVGPVISLKLVFDRESGKPKGYGFCEYKDQETALSAMRNLNGYEIGGRTLRVDNACTEKSRMEMAALLQGPQSDNPYGDMVNPEDAPEVITKTVASLPPEQMFELMKQMKACIQNNPNEARQMLLQNPQLAYALLQAMVVMKILDPTAAVNYLVRGNTMPPVITNASLSGPPGVLPAQQVPQLSQQQPQPVPPVGSFAPIGQDIDLRDPRLSRQMPSGPSGSSMDQDLRLPPSGPPVSTMPSLRPPVASFDPRQQDPRQVDPRQMDPRQRPVDPRARPQVAAPSIQQMNNQTTEQEKAQLIMQVLQLTDEQISMLPPEQRNSILALKDQIAKSAQR